MIFLIPTIAFADDCVLDPVSGDKNCTTSWGTYTIPSPETLANNDLAQQAYEAQQNAILQQKELNNEAQQEVLANTIANDPILNQKQGKVPLNPAIPKQPSAESVKIGS